jgi:hypothetical protein
MHALNKFQELFKDDSIIAGIILNIDEKYSPLQNIMIGIHIANLSIWIVGSLENGYWDLLYLWGIVGGGRSRLALRSSGPATTVAPL